MTTLGILGAGRVGTAIAREALRVGCDVLIAASGDPSRIALIAEVMAPGAKAVTAAEAVATSDITILAVPLHRHSTLDPQIFAGHIVIDAMNHWADTDGPLPAEAVAGTTSEMVAAHLAGARVVKTFNHIGYHEMASDPLPADVPGRRALAVAGDDAAAREAAMELIDLLGFDPVDAGPLVAGAVFEPGTEIFNGRFDRAGLMAQLELAGVVDIAS